MAPNPLIAKIQIAKKELGMADDDYRALLLRITGKDSSTKLTDAQRIAVLAEFARLGWNNGKPAFKKSSKLHVRKVWALWSAMCDDDIPEVKTRAALVAFIQRQANVDDPEWLTVDQSYKVIEGLKSWRKRVEQQRSQAL